MPEYSHNSFIKRLFNLYLYSSLHIGLGALCLCYFSFLAFGLEHDWTYILFAFSSTVFLYCLHRYIGIKKIVGQKLGSRFEVITQYRSHILIYAIISGILALYCFLQFEQKLQLLLLLPSVLSLLYALPLLGSGKRLRDLSYIKILLIGVVWSWITIGLPLLMYQEQNSLTLLLSLERFLFFIAITIPFDIRDQEIDKQSEVKTLIHLWGSRRSLNICYLLLTVCAGIAITCYISELIQVELLISLLLTYGFTGLCIFISTGKTHDYYYSGLLDGTMFLPLLFYMLIGVLA